MLLARDIVFLILMGLFVIIIYRIVKKKKINLKDQRLSSPEEMPQEQAEPVPSEPQSTQRPRLLTIEERISAGKDGERRVKRELEKLVSPHETFHDVWIYISEDRKCQIDHIVVSDQAIFVLETKNYSGRSVISQMPNGEWVNNTNGSGLPNPYCQIIDSCNILKNVFYRETGEAFTIQPIVIFCNSLQLENVGSNIPTLRPSDVPIYIMNYYASYFFSGKKRNMALEILKRIAAREMYTRAKSASTSAVQ